MYKKITRLVIAGLMTCLLCMPVSAFAAETGVTAHLGGDVLNVRAGAGINGAWIGILREGAMVNVLNSVTADGATWYEIEYNNATAYVHGDYVDIGGEAPAPVPGEYSTGRVCNIEAGNILNVRSGAGTGNSRLGYLQGGAEVVITGEASSPEGEKWYRIDYYGKEAYVHGDYISKDSSEPTPEPEPQPEPEPEPQPDVPSDIKGSGKIVNLGGDILNVRANAGLDGRRLGTLVEWSRVAVIGATTGTDGALWYKIEYNGGEAYIHGDYVEVTPDAEPDPEPVEPADPAEDPENPEIPSETQIPGKVINLGGDVLNIRAGAGTSYDRLGTFVENDEVTVIGTASDFNNTKWYKIYFGGKDAYVHSYYVELIEEPGEDPDDPMLGMPATGGDGSVPAIVADYTGRAIAYANDDSHGYRAVVGDNAGYGTTGSFDCGGLVTRVLWDSGILPKNKFYEPNSGLQWVPLQYGFEMIDYSYDQLQYGDILYHYGHTVIYVGDGKVVGAHNDQGYPQAGDQNGGEVSVSGFYGGWEYIFRYAG